jgi:multidrug resistance efflux pump
LRPLIFALRPAVRALAVLAAATGLFAGCSREDEKGEDEEAAAVAPADTNATVAIATAVVGELPVVRRALGVVDAPRQAIARVTSRLAAVVAAVDVVDGQEVAAGDVLVRLDAPSAAEALARTSASLASADSELRRANAGGLDASQADLDLAAAQADVLARQTRQEASRQESLLAENLTSEKAATEARQAAESAERASHAAAERSRLFRENGRAAEIVRLQASVDQARAERRTAEIDADSIVVRAPSAGRVMRLQAVVGRAVEKGAALADVVGSDALAVRTGLAPSDVEGVVVGAAVSVPRGESAISGRVTSVGAALDADTGLVPIEAKLDAAPSGSAMPRVGETVVVEIAAGAAARGVIVPVAALSVVEDRATVHVVDANEIAHATTVRIVTRNHSSAIVEGEGVADGVRIVVDGNYNLPDGAHVVPRPER